MPSPPTTPPWQDSYPFSLPIPERDSSWLADAIQATFELSTNVTICIVISASNCSCKYVVTSTSLELDSSYMRKISGRQLEKQSLNLLNIDDIYI